MSRTSIPPLYTQIYLWSCSVALRSPPSWLLMRARGGDPWGRGALLRKNRQPRHPCAPHVCSGRQHSGSSPTQTLGHAPFLLELEIAVFAPAAPELKVVRSPSKSRPAKNFANSPAIATHFTASPFRRMAINWPQPDTTASSSFGTPHPAKNSALSRDTTALFTASRSARTGASLAAPAATHPSNFGTPQTANGSTPSGNRPANNSSPPSRPIANS